MPEKILVIDDALVIRSFLTDVLTDAGYLVDTAENGLEGCGLVVENDYAMIFCDIHMPLLNGLQTVAQIKKIKPNIPIIMTDSFPDRLAAEAAKAGAVCCLTKPFDLNEVKSTVNSILKNKVCPTK